MRKAAVWPALLLLSAALWNCSSSEPAAPCTLASDCASGRENSGGGVNGGANVTCYHPKGKCQAAPAGHLLGWGDSAVGSASITTILAGDKLRAATDLEFHPTTGDLWVLNREYPSTEPCEEENVTKAGCKALIGSFSVIQKPGSAAQILVRKTDPNGWHFLRRPPALAFGDNSAMATCGEARTGNYLNQAADFIGPSLWPADIDQFGVEPEGGNGSHLDMLHASPYCTGISHESDNIYWVMNGQIGSLDRYNFREPHPPGGDDHSDGQIYRYGQGLFQRVPDVPSHLVLSADKNYVYFADSGGGRIRRMLVSSGQAQGFVQPNHDLLEDTKNFVGVLVEDLVPAGTLTTPSGLERVGEVLYVSDHATGMIFAFSSEGKLLRSLDTGLGPGRVAGLALGPDDRLYGVDLPNNGVFRIDAR